MPPVRAPMTARLHGTFLSLLGERKMTRATDGGPSDRDRSRKRAVGKRQRQARKRQRGQG